MELILDDARRLTGPNLLWDKPGAIIDVLISGIDKNQVVSTWQTWLDTLLAEFNWQQTHTYRVHDQGANLALSAPMDALYTACELVELAWHCTAAQLTGETLPNWAEALVSLKGELADELNPALLKLIDVAAKHNVSCISDDDEVSLGMGKSVAVWPARALPDVHTIDWTAYRDIPRAFITGTNGKSTSVRLAAQIAKEAGVSAGVTSTDFIRVGDDILDTGDYSGPGGARMLLRDNRTEMAFLEVARGGILRRGIPVDRVNAALITNVASDHLGQYGINTVEELAEAKFVVAKGLDDQGILVVNADNALVVKQTEKLTNKICWFSTDEHNPLIQQQLKRGERAVFLRSGKVTFHYKGKFECIAHVDDIPMTLNGAALHNVQNVLGVIGLCQALNLPLVAMQQGVRKFGSDAKDNPGRGNVYNINGFTVIVDFAHNEHSMQAVVNTVKQMPANRRIVMFSHGGDRSDTEIQNLTKAVTDLQANMYIITEIERYLRGRELGEIPTLVRNFLQQTGIINQDIHEASCPIDGAKLAVQGAQAGDIVLLFVLAEREDVHEYLLSLSD